MKLVMTLLARDEADIVDAQIAYHLHAGVDCVEQADVVLVPGSPLTHPDHVWLSALLAPALLPERVALYAEQPYTLRGGGTPFVSEQVGARDRLAKWHAIRAYRSQLPLLGMKGDLRRGPLRLALADERVAWPVSTLRDR